MWRIKLRIKVSVQLRAQIGQGRDSGRVAKGPALTLPFSLLSIFPFYLFCPFIPFPSPLPLPFPFFCLFPFPFSFHLLPSLSFPFPFPSPFPFAFPFPFPFPSLFPSFPFNFLFLSLSLSLSLPVSLAPSRPGRSLLRQRPGSLPGLGAVRERLARASGCSRRL